MVVIVGQKSVSFSVPPRIGDTLNESPIASAKGLRLRSFSGLLTTLRSTDLKNVAESIT